MVDIFLDFSSVKSKPERSESSFFLGLAAVSPAALAAGLAPCAAGLCWECTADAAASNIPQNKRLDTGDSFMKAPSLLHLLMNFHGRLWLIRLKLHTVKWYGGG